MPDACPLQHLVSACQILAGCIPGACPEEILDRLETIGEAWRTERPSPRAELLAHVVLTQFTGRLLTRIGVAEDAAVASAFVAAAALEGRPDWRMEWLALIRTCRSALPGSIIAGHGDARVVQLLQTIAARFRTPGLRLDDVADATHVSPTHAARLLRRHTGMGFVAHVRQHRMTRAQHLLARTRMTVKEVAALTGYDSARHFQRDFRRHVGLSPSQFRSRTDPR